MKTTLTLPFLAHLPHALPWSARHHPRLVAALVLGAALLGGAAMQHGVDRLEDAARTRATLERQSSALHERYTVMPATATPALAQLRQDYDQAIDHAATLARWSIWGTLAGLGAMAALSAWSLRRPASRPAQDTTPACPAPQATAAALPPAETLTATPAMTHTAPGHSPAHAPAPSLDDIAREMREVSALIGGWAGTAAPERQPDAQRCGV